VSFSFLVVRVSEQVDRSMNVPESVLVVYETRDCESLAYLVPCPIFDSKYRAVFDAAQDECDASDAYETVSNLLSGDDDNDYDTSTNKSLCDIGQEDIGDMATEENTRQALQAWQNHMDMMAARRAARQAFRGAFFQGILTDSVHWEHICEFYFFQGR